MEAENLLAERLPPVVQQQQGVVVGQEPRLAGAVVDKRAAIPHSNIAEAVNESDWSFFAAQWGHYKTSTELAGASEVQHL